MGKPSDTNPLRQSLPQRPLPAVLSLLLALLCSICAPSLSAQTTSSSSVSALSFPLQLPSVVAFDSQGNLYLAETSNHVIRKVDPTGHITTLAGTGTQGYSGDSGPATAAQLDSPQGLALDTSNNLYIADTHNHRIRRIDATTGIITTVAGTGTPSFSGDGAQATAATLNVPTALVIDSPGNLYIADTGNHRIRKITATTGIITTVAGTGTQGFSGDSAPATQANIDSPAGLALDTLNNLYLADTHNHRIRKITAATGIITTLAGTGTPSFSGDGAQAAAATLNFPTSVTLDSSGNLYLADTEGHRIRRIDAATGIITTVAGNGTQSFAGDTLSATTASLNSPHTVVISPSGLLTLADTGNQRIRQRAADNTITTIAGLGVTLTGTLTLTSPSVIAYGTGTLTAHLISSTPATGSITFLDTKNSNTNATTLGTVHLSVNTATISTATLPAGSHSIVATFAGDLSHASAQSTASALTIKPVPAAITFTPSASTSAPGIPITLSAQVSSTTTGTPSGIITFFDGSTPLSTATLTAPGTAAFTTAAFTPGPHTLTTLYSGDTNFLTSTSTPFLLTVLSTPPTSPDFTLVATGITTQVVPSGTTVAFTFTTQTQGSLSSPITLAAAGLPPGATASFNPAYLPPGNATNTFTLTLTTVKSSSANQSTPSQSFPYPAALALLLIPILSRTRRTIPALSIFFAVCATALCVGCGDRINADTKSPTQTQSFTITVTGTATSPAGSTLQHAATVTLQLQ